MATELHLQRLGRRVVCDWAPPAPLPDLRTTAPRLSRERGGGPTFEDVLAALTADPRASEARALVVGPWMERGRADGAESAAAALIAAAPGLPALEALFFGDITYESCELSWIEQTEVGALVMAFPALRVFGVRGGMGLSFTALRHEALEELIVQAVGVDPGCIADLAAAALPRLRSLELWIGGDFYDAEDPLRALAPILSGKCFPQLSHLGLCNHEGADALARLLATAPVVEQLRSLELSMGMLTDEGAEALLSSPAVARLSGLELSDNFLSEDMCARLEAALPGRVECASQRDDAQGRYIMHQE